MKKFAKVSLITAGVFLAIGCILAFISIAFGGRELIRIIREEDDYYFHERIEAFADAVGNSVYSLTDGRWGYVRDNAAETRQAYYEVDASQISNLEFIFGAGEFTIEEADTQDDKIEIRIQGIGRADYSVKGDTLHINGFGGHRWGDNLGDNRIDIKIPRESSFEEISVETGAGATIFSGIRANELEAEVGAGSVQLYEAEVNNASLSVGMGECIYEGAIRGNLDAECGMGDMTLMLSGKETDHNYEIECSVGVITIGGFSVSGLASEKLIDHNAQSEFDIECGMGNIEIIFEE